MIEFEPVRHRSQLEFAVRPQRPWPAPDRHEQPPHARRAFATSTAFDPPSGRHARRVRRRVGTAGRSSRARVSARACTARSGNAFRRVVPSDRDPKRASRTATAAHAHAHAVAFGAAVCRNAGCFQPCTRTGRRSPASTSSASLGRASVTGIGSSPRCRGRCRCRGSELTPTPVLAARPPGTASASRALRAVALGPGRRRGARSSFPGPMPPPRPCRRATRVQPCRTPIPTTDRAWYRGRSAPMPRSGRARPPRPALPRHSPGARFCMRATIPKAWVLACSIRQRRSGWNRTGRNEAMWPQYSNSSRRRSDRSVSAVRDTARVGRTGEARANGRAR